MFSCPRCKSPMTPGFLGTEASPSGLRWFPSESHFGSEPGEPVGARWTLRMEYVRGERCEACGIMVISY